jgi:hypothetical protein
MESGGDLEIFTEEFLKGIYQHSTAYLSKHPDILNPTVWRDDDHDPAIIILNTIAITMMQKPISASIQIYLILLCGVIMILL